MISPPLVPTDSETRSPSALAEVTEQGRMHRWLVRASAVIPLVLLAGALGVLHRHAHGARYRDIMAGIGRLDPLHIAAALAFAALGYVLLAVLDATAIHYVGRRLPVHRVAMASFVASAFSHSLGISALTGAAIRYRLYTGWGLSALEVAQVVAFGATSFWLGGLTAGGIALLAAPGTLGIGGGHVAPAVVRLAAVGCLMLSAGYIAACRFRRTPIRLRGLEIVLPDVRLALIQVVVATLDWCATALVLWALLPRGGSAPSPLALIGPFIVSQALALVSHVPGGIGVFDAAIVVFLTQWIPAAAGIASVAAFRICYYLVPLCVAVVVMAAREIAVRRAHAVRAARFAAAWIPTFAPTLLALAVFVGGMVLLFSGATPPLRARVQLIAGVLPRPMVEAAYLTGSVVGALLLFVARGLQKRLDGAYVLALGLLTVGAVASLAKGWDYEEAIYLATVALALAPMRRHFFRRASIFAEPLTPAWNAAIVSILVAAAWLVIFTHRHVSYDATHLLLLQAPRGLRATTAAVIVAGLFGVARLLRPARPDPGLPDADEIARAITVVGRSHTAAAHLALIGDKPLLFAEGDEGMVMYGVVGNTWIAMGDPVGSGPVRVELAWQFAELAERHDGDAVFYLVTPENLPTYIDLGMALVKLGETARVSLESFSLAGGERKWLRRARKNAIESGCTFEILPVEATAELLPELRIISDGWLTTKRVREKRFSMGAFEEAYIRRCPIALIRHEGRLVAFSNLWLGAPGTELSVDLIRYDPYGPSGLVDFLFAELLLWGKEAGYTWFDLGMAPLSGLESRALAPLWQRLGGFVFRHGERFYNFQGLRKYKEKFYPVWEPRYLASPGGLAVPRVLARVAMLVSGGARGVVGK